MSIRQKHCGLAILNSFGRCIANCYWNIQNLYNRDCTGKEREPFDPEEGKEIEVGGKIIRRGTKL